MKRVHDAKGFYFILFFIDYGELLCYGKRQLTQQG